MAPKLSSYLGGAEGDQGRETNKEVSSLHFRH
jgi:hypothetical protein